MRVRAARPPFDSLLEGVIRQESGGKAGILGPQTKYGRAAGLTQLLPGTAKEMATKLGVAWNPGLLRDRSPLGATYQRNLGAAYLKQGLEETGNPRDALHYYHGGPDRKLWGPKTRAYADAILGRLGGR